tara:strand:+ start:32 stop:280 length:249 start_codon:yes stop_codon:yes gene_type:complete
LEKAGSKLLITADSLYLKIDKFSSEYFSLHEENTNTSKKNINCRNEEVVIGAKNTQIKNSKSSLLECKSKFRLSDLQTTSFG